MEAAIASDTTSIAITWAYQGLEIKLSVLIKSQSYSMSPLVSRAISLLLPFDLGLV